MTFQIFVKGANSGSQVLSVTKNTMPVDCFFLIDQKACEGKMSPSYENGKIKFRLMYNGRFLDNNKGLMSQGVGNNSTLQLRVHPVR